MSGVQLAQGGLGNRISQAAPRVAQAVLDPRNAPQNNIPVLKTVNQFFQKQVPEFVSGVAGEYGGSRPEVGRVGFDNPPVFQPKSTAQNVGSEAYKLIEDIAVGNMTGVNQALDQGMKTLVNIPAVQKPLNVAGEKISSIFKPKAPTLIDDVLAQQPAQVDDILGGAKPAVEAPIINPADKKIIETVVKNAPEVPATSVTVTQPTLSQTTKAEGGLTKGANWLQRNTLETRRLLRKVLPENLGKQVDDTIFRPLMERNAQGEAFTKGVQNQIQSLGKNFTKGSKYSELTQKFGEGLVDEDALIREVGEQGATEIKNADNLFRTLYDQGLDTVNKLRLQDGLNPIEKRSDYYRHFNDLGSLFDSLSTGTASDAKSLSIQKAREGVKTTYDAVGGMLNWLEGAKRAGFTDKVGEDASKFAQELGASGADSKIVEKVAQFSDRIFGKQPESGKVVKALNKGANLIKKSQVMGNISTLVNQTMGIPQAMWDANPVNFVKGLVSKEAGAAAQESAYLKVRGSYVSPNLFKGMEKIDAIGGRTLQVADQTASTAIWKGFYEKAKQLAVSDPIKWADDAVEATVGSRGIGGGGQWLNSPLGKLLTPFVAEPTSQMNRLMEMVGENRYGALAGIVATNFLVNQATDKTYGQKPLFDPIGASVDAYRLATGDEQTDQNIIKAGARLFSEALQLNPVLQSGVASTYSAGETAGILPDSRDIFGSEDPTRLNVGNLYNPLANVLSKDSEGKTIIAPRNLTGSTPVDAILNPALKLVPGGNQIAKTTSGANSLITGNVKSRSGKVMYEGAKNPLEAAQALAFGASATPNAQKYFNDDFNRPLSEQESQIYESLPDNEKTAYLESTQASNGNNIKVDKVLSGGNAKGAGLFTLPDNATPKQQKDFNSNIGKALEAGVDVPAESLKKYVMKDSNPSSSSIEERTKAYSGLKTAMDNQYYSDEQKQAILDASGVDKKDYDYYDLAGKDQDVRLQELLPKLDNMDTKQLTEFLMQGRKVVAGKQLVSNTMVDYLYENGYIGENEKKAIKALKFDEIKNKFYFAKSFSDTGGMTYKQALALYKIDMPKFSTLKDTKSLLSNYGGSTQTSQANDKLIETILSRKPNKKTSTNGKLWF